MKTRIYTSLAPYLFLLVLTGILFIPSTLLGAEGGTFKAYSEIVDTGFVAQYAVIPPPEGALIIDSRPSRKYDSGHIVPSLNIPFSQFKKSTRLLPADKGSLLIFYCGGVKCPLSHKSAFAAEALGYHNIKVYSDGYPVWVKQGHTPGISSAYLKKMMDKGTDMMVVDARPERKFRKGHVPTALNIPYSQFDKRVGDLPADKAKPLIYYCGGFKCTLSTKSAAKAVALGYTRVALYQAGWPEWKKVYGDGSSTLLKTGSEEGMLTLDSFNRLLKEDPDSVHLIDVRDRSEVAADGTFSQARVLPIDEVEEAIADLPSDKPIVFFCSTGARSGEAYDMVKAIREELKAYFLDANVEFKKQAYPIVTPPE